MVRTKTSRDCTRCGLHKSLGEFGRRKMGWMGRFATCKSCEAAKGKEWAARNRDKVNASARRSYYRNKAAHAARHLEWQRANPDKVRERQAKRRGAIGEVRFSRSDWERALEEHNHACAYCGTAGVPLTQDHIEPLTKSGRHHWSNIAPACQPCNSAKGDRPLLVFLAKRRLNRAA